MWYRLKTDNQIYTASELIRLHLDSNALVKIVGRTPSWCNYNDDMFQRQLNADVGYAIGDDGVIHKKNGGASNDAEITDKIDQYDIGWKLWTNKEYTESLKWFLKSAYQGYAPGENMVGCQYHAGNGVDRNYAEAFKWWAKAAAQKDNSGIANLAMCYNDGIGVQVDFRKALELYLKVQEGTLSIYNIKDIATIYEEGKAGPPDFANALKWYRKAAARGDVDANNDVSRLENLNSIMNSTYTEGEKYYLFSQVYDKKSRCNDFWLHKAASKGHKEAKLTIRKRAEHGDDNGFLLNLLVILCIPLLVVADWLAFYFWDGFTIIIALVNLYYIYGLCKAVNNICWYFK